MYKHQTGHLKMNILVAFIAFTVFDGRNYYLILIFSITHKKKSQ